ncbi:MAG: hypothetical protein IPN95_29890 [Bacteroidetes bacterium]|nr:hypothetical protein [Bacteroidota bacterium]
MWHLKAAAWLAEFKEKIIERVHDGFRPTIPSQTEYAFSQVPRRKTPTAPCHFHQKSTFQIRFQHPYTALFAVTDIVAFAA